MLYQVIVKANGATYAQYTQLADNAHKAIALTQTELIEDNKTERWHNKNASPILRYEFSDNVVLVLRGQPFTYLTGSNRKSTDYHQALLTYTVRQIK